MDDPLPFMKLWTHRFLGSSRVQALPGVDRWLYLGLLVHEWERNGEGLPKDTLVLARLLGVDSEDFERSWDGRSGDAPGAYGISQFFEVRNGRLYNETLEEQLREQKDSRHKYSSAGKKGNKHRWIATRSRCDRPAIASRSHRASDVCLGSKEGDEGANGGEPPEGVKDLLEEIRKFDNFGEAKARAILAKLRDPKRETFEAWKAYEAEHGTRSAAGAMQAHSHPSEVREKVIGFSSATAKSRGDEELREAALRKRHESERAARAAELAADLEEVVPPEEEALLKANLKRILAGLKEDP